MQRRAETKKELSNRKRRWARGNPEAATVPAQPCAPLTALLLGCGHTAGAHRKKPPRGAQIPTSRAEGWGRTRRGEPTSPRAAFPREFSSEDTNLGEKKDCHGSCGGALQSSWSLCSKGARGAAPGGSTVRSAAPHSLHGPSRTRGAVVPAPQSAHGKESGGCTLGGSGDALLPHLGQLRLNYSAGVFFSLSLSGLERHGQIISLWFLSFYPK